MDENTNNLVLKYKFLLRYVVVVFVATFALQVFLLGELTRINSEL